MTVIERSFINLQQTIRDAGKPVVRNPEQISIAIIKDFLPDLQAKYPEQVKCIRELLDTMED